MPRQVSVPFRRDVVLYKTKLPPKSQGCRIRGPCNIKGWVPLGVRVRVLVAHRLLGWEPSNLRDLSRHGHHTLWVVHPCSTEATIQISVA